MSLPQVETVGDTYMLVAGLPKRLHLTHAAVVAESALALMKASHEFRIPHMPGSTLKLRVGMHSGTHTHIGGKVHAPWPKSMHKSKSKQLISQLMYTDISKN